MNYSEMTDFEINKSVGEIVFAGKWACKPGTAGNDSDLWYYGSVDTFVTPYASLPDYCNSWADAGLIIEEYRINVMFNFGNPFSYKPERDKHGVPFSRFKYEDAKPLRAAMIVFLMMQEDSRERTN